MVVLHYIRWSSYAERFHDSELTTRRVKKQDKWREVSQLYAISIRFCDHQKIIILYMYAVDQCMVHVNYNFCLLYTSDAADE